MHYVAVQKLLALLRGITSKHYSDFIVWITFILLLQKTNFNDIKKVCENKDICNITMSSEDTKILEFNQFKKSDKGSFIIYVDFELK